MKINKNQMLPTFGDTITILNKLKAIHSASKMDIWKKTVLDNCFFSSQAVRNIKGTTVTMGNNFICRVPKNKDYSPYNEWSKDLTGFTFSTGDFIVNGIVTEEIIDANNIKKIIEQYKPNTFEIRFFKDNTNSIPLLAHYHLGGV